MWKTSGSFGLMMWWWRLRRFWNQWRSGGWGVLSQVLTLAATVLPVAFGHADGLVLLVVATAVASVFVPLATLAAQYRVPLGGSPEEVSNRVLISGVFCMLVSLMIGMVVLAVSLAVGAPDPIAWTLAVSGLCATQGIFTIAFSALVRGGEYSALMYSRLAYGAGAFLLTIVALANGGSGLALTGAISGGYLLGAAQAVVLARSSALRRQISLPTPTARGFWREVWDARTLSVSGVVGALAGQLGALATPLLGSIDAVWAAIVRTMSGFQTAGTVILGAAVDAAASKSLRAGDRAQGARRIAQATWAGVGLGIASIVCAGAAAAFVAEGVAPLRIEVVFAVILYCGTSVALAPIGRALGMAGNPRGRLHWDVLRCVLFGVALVAPTPAAVLVALGIGGALSYLAYLWLLHRTFRDDHR